MIPMLLAGPSGEPVSLAAVKAHLRLDGDEEDELLAMLITASRLVVEAACGRLLLTQTWRLSLDAWPVGGVIRIPFAPVQSLSAVTVMAGDGSPQALPLAGFRLERSADPPLLVAQGLPPAPGLPRAGIEIDLAAGFGDDPEAVPAPLVQAILVLTARWFENRGDLPDRDELRLPAPVSALIAPYRRARL